MLTTVELSKRYKIKSKKGTPQFLKAVDNVSICMEQGKSYGLVGESGSGKSTLAKLLVGLEKPTSGQIFYNGENVLEFGKKNYNDKIRKDFKIVFQNSGGALNPRWKIKDSISEPLVNRKIYTKEEQLKKVKEYLDLVKLSQNVLDKLPHELSGGEQTRTCIARALITNPKFLVFDESVSGLDVTIKKQILDLILNIEKEINCTYLFITHDIESALYISNNLIVMKDGSVIENLNNMKSLDELKHEYSRLLVKSVFDLSKDKNTSNM